MNLFRTTLLLLAASVASAFIAVGDKLPAVNLDLGQCFMITHYASIQISFCDNTKLAFTFPLFLIFLKGFPPEKVDIASRVADKKTVGWPVCLRRSVLASSI